MSDIQFTLSLEEYLAYDSQLAVALKAKIKCPQCMDSCGLDDWSFDSDTDVCYGSSVCGSCTESKDGWVRHYTFSWDCFIGRFDPGLKYGIVNVYKPTNYNQEKEMQKVYVIRHKEAKNLIVGVLTTLGAADDSYGHIDTLEIVPFECEHQGESFPVWLVTVGKDDATRYVGVFSDKKQAGKIASSVGGRIRENEAIPNRRERTGVRVYKTYMNLQKTGSRRVEFIDSLRVNKKIFQGEESSIFPVATFRRPYQDSIPHRIEVLATTERGSKNIATDLSELTNDEICAKLEYNIDYKLVKENGKWVIDPSLLDQPVCN